MTDLVLPDPQTTAIANLGQVVSQCALIRAQCEADRDTVTAQELHRRLAALSRYLTDKEARAILEAEQRRAEVLIGKLLGPAVNGRPVNGGSKPSNLEGLPFVDRNRFRTLSDNEDRVEELLSAGVVKRAAILRELEPEPEPLISPLEIRDGDFRQVLADLEPSSVDLIFTDPPYSEDSVALYADLGRFAAEKLAPGGSLLAYTGQHNLPAVLNVLGEALRYWWTLALRHRHGGQQLPGKWVIVEWKPIVWFVKDKRATNGYVADSVAGTKPDKGAHEWAQGEGEAAYLIEQLTEPGALVVDPFTGSGTTGRAAHGVGRRFIGAEVGRAG